MVSAIQDDVIFRDNRAGVLRGEMSVVSAVRYCRVESEMSGQISSQIKRRRLTL